MTEVGGTLSVKEQPDQVVKSREGLQVPSECRTASLQAVPCVNGKPIGAGLRIRWEEL